MERDAFRKAALAEMGAVYRLAYHLSSEPQDVDDLVQETYLRALNAGDGFELGAHGVRPWLFKILHNVISRHFGKAGRRPVLLDDLAERPAPTAVDLTKTCDELATLNWDDVDERLKGAIHALPLTHRTVFLLCAVEGLKYREIAEVLDLPLGTVMSRLHRARTALAADLASLAIERRMRGGSDAEKGIQPSP